MICYSLLHFFQVKAKTIGELMRYRNLFFKRKRQTQCSQGSAVREGDMDIKLKPRSRQKPPRSNSPDSVRTFCSSVQTGLYRAFYGPDR